MRSEAQPTMKRCEVIDLKYLGLGTMSRKILEFMVMQSGLRYFGLGTLSRGLLEFMVVQSGLRHLGLGTLSREILEFMVRNAIWA